MPRTYYAAHTKPRLTGAPSCLHAFQLPAQEPKLVSGAKISDATQVMQSTITPASAPTPNINEKHFGPEPKTVDQARRACLYPPRHTHATRDPPTPLDLA